MVMAKIDKPVIKFPPRHIPDFPIPQPFPLPQPTDVRDQAAFDILDTDGNGKISKDEFKRAGIAEDRQKLFDADGNGEVSEQEYGQTRRYEREFNAKDDNGDGSLNRDEFNPFQIRPEPFPIDKPWFAKLADKAGLKDMLGGAAAPADDATANDKKLNPVQVGNIWHNPGFFPTLKDRFARFDKDGDGKVSKEEYVAGRRAEDKPPVIWNPPIYYKAADATLQPRKQALKKEITNGTDTLKLSSNVAPDEQK